MSEILTTFLSFFLFIPLYIINFIQPGLMDARDGLLLYPFLPLFSKRWIKSKPKSVGGDDNLSFFHFFFFSPPPRGTRYLAAGDWWGPYS